MKQINGRDRQENGNTRYQQRIISVDACPPKKKQVNKSGHRTS